MKQAECGQMTIFLSLMLISFFMILCVCIEGIYVHMQKADFIQQQLLVGESALANYHEVLAEQFHIFAIDGRYVAKMETSLKRKLEQNAGDSCDTFVLSDQINITQEDGDILKHQIREYMKYKETANLLNTIKKSFNGVENDTNVKQLQSTIDRIEGEETDSNSEESSTEQEKIEDPRKGLSQLLSKGILNLVVEDEKNISEKEIAIVYGGENKKKELKINFFEQKSVSDLFNSTNKKSAISGLSTEGLGILYADEVFSNAVQTSPDDQIQYEMEYLIAGKSNDQSNLKSVVCQLLAIRFALNYGYLLSDSKSLAEAYALAAGIANVGSAVPGVIEGIKLLILAAWAYGESIVDLRVLLKGNKIPFVKTSTSWQLKLSNLATLTAKEKSADQGNSYADYLNILLLLQTDKNEKYRRMMDLMEQRIQIDQKDFRLSDCLFSYKMTIAKEIPSLFYSIGYQTDHSRIYTY